MGIRKTILLLFTILPNNAHADISKKAISFGNKMSKMLEEAGSHVKVNCQGTTIGSTSSLVCKWVDEEKKSAVVIWSHTGHGEDDIKMYGNRDTEAGIFAQDFFELIKDKTQDDFFRVK